MKVFPVQGVRAGDFASAFSAGHGGTDIFAKEGTPLYAVADGTVRHEMQEKGGRAVYLVEPDRTQYFYGHLSEYAFRLGPGQTRKVKAGELLGYVGTTGSAQGREPHLHFEVRPQGGAKVDPYPYLERLHRAGAWGGAPAPGSVPPAFDFSLDPPGTDNGSMGLVLLGLLWMAFR